MSTRNAVIFRIQNRFSNFPNNAFETTEFWCIVGLTAILCEKLLQSVVFVVA